jgi:hypothetical protein
VTLTTTTTATTTKILSLLLLLLLLLLLTPVGCCLWLLSMIQARLWLYYKFERLVFYQLFYHDNKNNKNNKNNIIFSFVVVVVVTVDICWLLLKAVIASAGVGVAV